RRASGHHLRIGVMQWFERHSFELIEFERQIRAAVAAEPEVPNPPRNLLRTRLHFRQHILGGYGFHFELKQPSVSQVTEGRCAGGIGAIRYHGNLPTSGVLAPSY